MFFFCSSLFQVQRSRPRLKPGLGGNKQIPPLRNPRGIQISKFLITYCQFVTASLSYHKMYQNRIFFTHLEIYLNFPEHPQSSYFHIICQTLISSFLRSRSSSCITTTIVSLTHQAKKKKKSKFIYKYLKYCISNLNTNIWFKIALFFLNPFYVFSSPRQVRAGHGA